MTDTSNRFRKGRGMAKFEPTQIASAALTNAASVTLLASASNVVRVVDRIYFQYPTDVTQWDAIFKVNGVIEDGTERTIVNIDNSGTSGPTDLRVIFTYDVSNPPTGFIYGYWEAPNMALGPSGDTLTVIGGDATAGNNYTSTGAKALVITVHYREIDSSVW